MARRKYPRPLAIDLFRPLDRDGAVLLNDQLAERIEILVAHGRLKAGDYLPPLRLLARKLDVSVGTVARAYEAIRRRGLAIPHSTRGMRVARPDDRVVLSEGPGWGSLVSQPVAPTSPLDADIPRVQSTAVARFDISEPGSELMPAELVRRAFSRSIGDVDQLRYAPLTGSPIALGAIERYLRERAVALDGASLLLTSGTTQSLAIITRALLPPGGVVLTEHPTWHVALSVFGSAGARVVALPVDDNGLQVGSLADAVLRHNPAFLYVQPAFQNPTGLSLCPERRAELLALARKLHLVIVEDDFASELAYETPPPPLRGPAGVDVVIHMRSFAKLIAPALRVGAIVAPPQFASALRAAKHGLDPFVSALAQRVLAHCLADSGFERHVRGLAGELRHRWQALAGALAQRMPADVRWTTPQGGFCAWMQLPRGADAGQFIRETVTAGVGLVPGNLFCVDGSAWGAVRLAFGATSVEEIERGVEIMASILGSQDHIPRIAHRVPHAVAP
jgi:2-aminoadipate transaminase